MRLFSEQEWRNFFVDVGFNKIKLWKVGKKNNWNGTLIITGIK